MNLSRLVAETKSPFAPSAGNDSETSLPPVDEDTEVLKITNNDWWTIRSAFEGTQIFGATGSGKSSGSGRTIAIQFLKSGMGGLVLTAKPDECAEWKRYAEAAGRNPDDIIVLSPTEPYSFGFFEYEREVAQAENLPVTETIVNLFGVLLEVGSRKGGNGGDPYWEMAVKQLVRNAVDTLIFAGRQLTFENMYSLITSAPTTPAEADQLRDTLIDDTAKSCGMFRECVMAIMKGKDISQPLPALKLSLAYWFDEYSKLAPETRGSIVSYFTTIADLFSRGILSKIFSPAADPKFNFSPDLSRKGKILIVDLPVKRFYDTGQLAQVLYKFIWQRAAEREAGADVRPMFLWADESQFFVNRMDVLFQTTARSAKVATVYLTQNISNYYVVMPGSRAEPEANSLLGNFNTKIFHANSDAVTNNWASDMIGKNWQFRQSIASGVSSSLNDPASESLFS